MYTRPTAANLVRDPLKSNIQLLITKTWFAEKLRPVNVSHIDTKSLWQTSIFELIFVSFEKPHILQASNTLYKLKNWGKKGLGHKYCDKEYENLP